MQTSAIHQRVADFLKGYPPFSYLDDGALERLASGGKVLFRQREDLIFEEGESRDRFVYVIQQGGVRLSQKRASQEALIDMRGVGELLGLGEAQLTAVHKLSAHALEDTILYALDREIFLRECQSSVRAERYLSILFASGDPDLGLDGRGNPTNWFLEQGPSGEWTGSRLLTCAPDRLIRDAARDMLPVDDGPMLVVDAAGKPLGIITDLDLLDRVATGHVPLDAPVTALMTTPVMTVSPGTSVGESLLRMMRHVCRHLCVTEDGTAATRAVGVVSERDLMLFYGNNPLIILRSMGFAGDVETLAAMRDRADVLLRTGLRSFVDVDWYCEIMTEINRSLVRRIVELVASHPGDMGNANIMLVGASGRRELLGRTDIGNVLILPDGEVLQDRRDVLLDMDAALQRCGFAQQVPSAIAPDERCGTVSEWEQRFERWVTHPLDGGIYNRLRIFDFDPLEVGCRHAERVRKSLRGILQANPQFVALLANDTLEHLPPLTIFEGYAVDAKGQQINELDIKFSATRAVIDAARVLALEAGDLSSRSTLQRLESAQARIPEAADVLTGAARAFRIAMFQRTVNAFRTGGDGRVLSPATLSPTDQALLKSSFTAIARLLAFIAKRYGLE